jgi:hypothetical protein
MAVCISFMARSLQAPRTALDQDAAHLASGVSHERTGHACKSIRAKRNRLPLPSPWLEETHHTSRPPIVPSNAPAPHRCECVMSFVGEANWIVVRPSAVDLALIALAKVKADEL